MWFSYDPDCREGGGCDSVQGDFRLHATEAAARARFEKAMQSSHRQHKRMKEIFWKRQANRICWGRIEEMAHFASRETAAGYTATVSRKTPNVAGNRLAEGKSELTGLLGGPARSEKE